MPNPFARLLEADGRDCLTLALAVTGVLGLIRLAVLFLSPIQLYPDEAQYWVWSRDLAWGYFSKPPMVAWMIAASTAIGGQAEAWIRLPSILLHGGSALILFDVARRLYGPRVALLTCLVYNLMPGVQLSCGVASTDAPLMFFLCGALWAYVRLLHAPARREGLIWGALLGAALGLAFLSKYAAVYFLVGLAVHAFIAEEARKAWRPRALLATTAALLTVFGPNLRWNARQGFVTFSHTVENADWKSTSFFHPGEAISFIAAQIGVFGLVPFVAVTLGLLLALRRRWRGDWPQGADGLLICLTLPPIIAVTIQALLSRANANWAFAAYGPASILAAAWLARWRATGWTAAGLAAQGMLAALFLAGAAYTPLADMLGLGNSLKRSRGWEEMTQAILDRAAQESAVHAIAVDSRFLYNEMRYYGRDRLAAPDAPPLRMWTREVRPHNHAELTAPLRPGAGRILAVSLTPQFGREFARDFAFTEPRAPLQARLDHKRVRTAELFLGLGFQPAPRDPATGLPAASGPSTPP